MEARESVSTFDEMVDGIIGGKIQSQHPERPSTSDLLAAPSGFTLPEAPKEIRMQGLDGVTIAAAYTKPEQRLMSELRAGGSTDHELRFLHELKHHFDVDLVVDEVESADTAFPRARAVGSGSQWDDSRNTSNRSGHKYGLTEQQRARQERDAEQLEQQQRAADEAARQGSLFTEQGEDGAT